jgi:antitoxin VapB
MADTGIAKIFKHGRSQAVRLPLAFRLPGEQIGRAHV